MNRKPGKTFVEKDFKKNGLILGVVLIVILIIIALVTLLPNRTPQAGDLSRIGVSRSFMFPFAYLDENSALKVIDNDLNILAVDDSVTAPTHDFTKEKIYYLRENVLYEYDIKLDTRRILVGGSVSDFRVLNDRSAFVYVTLAKELHMYDYLTEKDIILGDNVPCLSFDNCLSVGRYGFIFMSDGDAVTADLYYGDNSGNVKMLAGEVTVGTAVISKNENYISYEKDGVLYITDRVGNVISSLKNSHLILCEEQGEAVAETPETGKLNEGVEISYVLSDWEHKLYYFTGKELKQIDSDVEDIVCFSDDSDRVFYTKTAQEESGQIDVMMSYAGKTAVSLVQVNPASKFAWLDGSGELYCLDGKILRCVSVFDNYKVRQVANGVTGLKYYPGKPFVVYTDNLRNNYYVMPGEKTEQVAYGSVRFYGLASNVYLLQSTYNNGYLSLDIVENDSMKRLDSNIIKVVALDSSMSQILYLNSKGLVLRTESETMLLDTPGEVTAVALKD